MSLGQLLRQELSFMNALEGQEHYDLSIDHTAETSTLEDELLSRAVGKIAMPIKQVDFEKCISRFETAIEESPGALEKTLYKLDSRFGNDIGYMRKLAKRNEAGLQDQDAKSLFHFNELARQYWDSLIPNQPESLRSFLEVGYDIHSDLIGVARSILKEFENTHPNINKAYFDKVGPGIDSFSFLRIISYDSFNPEETTGDVARPHFDIGGFTIQAYADGPGFWGNIEDGKNSEHNHYNTNPDEAFLFFGVGHSKMYSGRSPIKPLWHGVDRIVDADQRDAGMVPKRHAVILFFDPPHIDLEVTSKDTSPHLYE